MQGKTLSKISDTVMHFFNERVLEIDKQVNFVKRKSKLDARLFVQVLLMGCLSDPTISLERLCRLLKENGLKMTRQGLHQRFNAQARELMEQLFQESLRHFKTENQAVLDLLKTFSSIKIQDSSHVSLPSRLKEVFKGCGSHRVTEAGLKLQVLFDYMAGQIKEVTITEGCRSDQGFERPVESLEKGALYLQDLGYFKRDFFKKASAKGACFISRYSYPTSLLDEEGSLIDLRTELRKAGGMFARSVWLGKQEKIPVRLVAFRLPEQEVEKRLRKIKEKARKRGKASSQETLELAHWSIYLTNVSETVLKHEDIALIYSVRWQIELFFKLCKTEAGVDKVSGKKTERILCELYAKLTCIVLLLYICYPIRWQANQELSFYKAYKAMKLSAPTFLVALKSGYRLLRFIKSFLSDAKDFALKDKYRSKRRLTYQKIMDVAGQETLAYGA